MKEYKINDLFSTLKYERTLATFNIRIKNKNIRLSKINDNCHEHGMLFCQTIKKENIPHYCNAWNQELSQLYGFDF